MKTYGAMASAALLVAALVGSAQATIGDTSPRAMGMAQAYTGLARGPEAAFWNPANLGLSGSPAFSWEVLGAGFTLITANNSWSVSSYNDHFTDANKAVSPKGTQYYITAEDKGDLLADVPGDGLRMNLDVDPLIAAGLPLNGGVAFGLPGGLRSALAFGLTSGSQGEVPKDMVELMLFGNEFAADREEAGKPAGYDISKWDGSAWVVGSINWSVARPWMPVALAPYLSEFAVGGTLKLTGGAYTEVTDSGGEGLVSRVSGANIEAYLLTQSAGGMGVGLDVGVAGVTRNGKTTVSVGLLNLLDTISWGINARQDSVFIAADDLRLTRIADPDVENIEDVLDNEDVDGDGDVDFFKKYGEESFSRSLPAMLRVGVAHELSPRLTVTAAYDQAFSSGFGLSTTPAVGAGLEYSLVPWFPVRCGLAFGGRFDSSSAVGMALGPFDLSGMEMRLLELALVTRGGVFPGAAKGTALAVRLLDVRFI